MKRIKKHGRDERNEMTGKRSKRDKKKDKTKEKTSWQGTQSDSEAYKHAAKRIYYGKKRKASASRSRSITMTLGCAS